MAAVVKVLLKVVCTDKGQHPERMLDKLGEDRFPGILVSVLHDAGAFGNGRIVNNELSSMLRGHWPKLGPPRGTFTFWCSTCQRQPRIRDADLKKVIAAGESVLDISALPF